MDERAIAEALRAALPSVTILDNCPPGAGADLALVTRSTDVGIQDESGFRKFVKALEAVPEIASLEGQHYIASLAGGAIGPIRVEGIAKSMMAQALEGQDAVEIVNSFGSFIKHNRCETLIIGSLVAINASNKIDLGSGVSLEPLQQVPPSIPRGVALGQSQPFASANARIGATSALVTKTSISPVIVPSAYFSTDANISKYRAQIFPALSLLNEARNCLALLDMKPVFGHLAWSHFVEPGAFFLGNSGWTNFGGILSHDIPRTPDADRLRKLCSSYFRIPLDARTRVLHVPLDRLNRALMPPLGNFVDRAIDLGIALEALLLHDYSGHTELSYRLRLRGALLLGGDLAARRSTKKLLNDIYGIRGKAVHTGTISERQQDLDRFKEGISACGRLINIVIEKGGEIDFDELELGA
jgi:Apea-like HEPN